MYQAFNFAFNNFFIVSATAAIIAIINDYHDKNN